MIWLRLAVRRGAAVATLCAGLVACHTSEAGGQTTEPSTTQATTNEAFTAESHRPLSATRSSELKRLTLDELLNTEVTLVSRRPERVAETASAIQVITGEEIRRSGALTLPEALRLAPNLQVAQQTAHDWAITSRGFNGAPLSNNSLADKLLVMIDGRSVYTPLFGGVFWDVQNVLLEDVDRIEVVSGPGGTLWGANAVNGVINIVTKSARDTRGLYLSSAFGSTFDNYTAFRYGDSVGSNLFYRVYGFGLNHGSTYIPDDGAANDDWQANQGGMRFDYYPSDTDTLTLQGDVYGVREGDPDIPPASGGGPLDVNAEGGNLLSRWTHVISPTSDLIVQIYFDGTWRHLPDTGFGYAITTYDLDVQHRFALNDRNSILWGGGYRLNRDRFRNAPTVSILPQRRMLQLFNVFVQDEIQLVPDHLKLTIGSKLEHNDYSGFELQPSIRLAWTPVERHTIWGPCRARCARRLDLIPTYSRRALPSETISIRRNCPRTSWAIASGRSIRSRSRWRAFSIDSRSFAAST